MTLRTGNRGFTLIEVMVTVAVLSFGIVFIYQAYFTALDSFNWCRDYFSVANWMNEQMWLAQDSISRLGELSQPSSGELIEGSRVFGWSLNASVIDEDAGLQMINLVLTRKASGRPLRLSRSAYAFYEEE